MKSVLTIPNGEMKKLKAAARWSGVRIVSEIKQGPDNHAVEVLFPAPNNLVVLGGYLKTITDEQVKEELNKMADELKAAAEKAKAKGK